MATTTIGRSPKAHEPEKFTNDGSNDQSPTYSRDWMGDDVYYTTHSKPKSDIILLKMNSGDALFADASVNGTAFKFLMDTGASKSVMSLKHFMSIPEMFRPQLCNTRMKFQVANGEVLLSMGVAQVSIQMYGYTFKLSIFVCDLGDIYCIFGLDAGMEAGFITCAQTDRIWFNANEHDEPKQLPRSSSNAVCHLRAVQRIELKPFKARTIKVAYAKRAISKRWDGSQVHCMTHSSLWADLRMIMMGGIADLSSGSVKLDFVNSTSNPVIIKPGQIVMMAIQDDSVEMLPDTEPDDDKSISLTESVFSCVERPDNLLYPFIVSDKAMNAEKEEFDLDMDTVEAPTSRPQAIPREKGTMLKCVHDLFVRASKNLSPKESAKVK